MAKSISLLTKETKMDNADSIPFSDVSAGYDKRITAEDLRSDVDVAKVNNVASLFEGKRDLQAVNLLGYYTQGDGGGGLLYWDSASTETDNEVTIFQVDGVATGRWKRNVYNKLYSSWGGVINDGTDQYSKFINFINVAKSGSFGIDTGKGNLRLDISSTINLSGIPFWEGETEIDLSNGTSDRFFEVLGTKTKISSDSLSLSAGDANITVTGTASAADEILILSNEVLPNNPAGNYYKGERHVVADYSTGIITLQTPVIFDYTSSAFVFKVSPESITLSIGLTFRGKKNNDVCLRVRYANADIKCSFINFGYASVQFNSSTGSFKGNIKGAWYSGTPTSYGVSINDLSVVNVYSSVIYGGRHAIASGGGIESLTDIGGTGSAVYPCVFTVSNSFLATSTQGSVGALDAHGSVYSITASNNIIIGGIQSSANYSVITGNSVFFKTAAGFITPSQGDSVNWGNTILKDNHFIGFGGGLTGSGISVTGTSKSLLASGNSIYGDWEGTALSTATPIRISGQVTDVSICDNKIERVDTGASSERSTINVYGWAEFSNNYSTNNRYEIISKVANAEVLIKGNTIYNAPNSYGIYVNGSAFYFDNTRIIQNFVSGSYLGGIYVFKSTRVSALQNELVDNGVNTLASASTRVGLRLNDVAEIDLHSNLLGDNQGVATQQYGVYTFVHSTLTTNVRWFNNNLKGVANAAMYVLAGNILSQNGNRGTYTIPDYILGTDGSLYKFNGTAFVLA